MLHNGHWWLLLASLFLTFTHYFFFFLHFVRGRSQQGSFRFDIFFTIVLQKSIKNVLAAEKIVFFISLLEISNQKGELLPEICLQGRFQLFQGQIALPLQVRSHSVPGSDCSNNCGNYFVFLMSFFQTHFNLMTNTSIGQFSLFSPPCPNWQHQPFA